MQFQMGGVGVFVYFFHRPFLEWCRGAIVPLLKENGIMLNSLFVVLVVFYFPICLLIAKGLKKTLPLFYSMITGGRQ